MPHEYFDRMGKPRLRESFIQASTCPRCLLQILVQRSSIDGYPCAVAVRQLGGLAMGLHRLYRRPRFRDERYIPILIVLDVEAQVRLGLNMNEALHQIDVG